MPIPLEAAACAICAANDSEPILSARDPDGLSSRPFCVARCRACGMIYINPRPSRGELGRYYVPGYYGKPGEDSGNLGRWLSSIFMAERIKKASTGRRAGKILDIGCGDGTFLAAMSRRGWDAWGIDASQDGASRAAARPGVKMIGATLEDCDLPDKSFDIITFWHSIEHLPDPASALRRASALLKDDGRIFLAFPNPKSWDLRVFGARWFHLDPPRHLHYFSPEAMARLLQARGLRAERVSHFSWEYNPFGFAQSALNFMTRRMNYFYRRLKGTLPIQDRSARDAFTTAALLPLLAAVSLPYVFLASICRASGCVDVLAAKSDAARGGNIIR